ncbi:MAG TPA: VIT domain-containing protein [Hydrogenophaga sp.]|nr:VIT domain-containing protein [Hydrogenophaga sp.]HMN92737.1 VIT domain-containing protein [Hydrogenophaga sp.]
MLLEGVTARGRVVGHMLDMSLEQRFRNPGSSHVEVVYTFPLPWHAVLLGLEVELNGETLVGLVRPKAEARTDYEEALNDGDSAILVSMNHDRSYTLELGNLMAGESCIVRLHYVQTLKPEQGSLRLTLPTTIAPRYGDPQEDGGYEPHAVPEASTSVHYPFDIRLDIEGEMAQARIGSPSHRISLRPMPAGESGPEPGAEVRLGAAAWLDRDFVLVFEDLVHASHGLAARDPIVEGQGVVIASFTPRLPECPAQPVHMKILVDCSGSMGGDSIEAARNALLGIVEGLTPEDRFSLSRFGSHVEHRCKALWKGAPAALAAARRWAESLEADLGGTEMESAITSTLRLTGDKRSDVLLITDGEIEAVDDVVRSAQDSGCRFFVVGIGASVAEGLLRRLAESTGGSCEFVAPGEQVAPAILRLYRRMRTRRITHTRLQWPESARVQTVSDLPTGVFDGDVITVWAWLQTESPDWLCGAVRLLGTVEGDGREVCLAELQPTWVTDGADTLARLAASQRYGQLHRGSEKTDVVHTRQRTGLAEQYQLVTPDTSLILVKQRSTAERATDMPQPHKVKGMLAAGWGGTDRVLASPRRGDHSMRFRTVRSGHVATDKLPAWLSDPNAGTLPGLVRTLMSKAGLGPTLADAGPVACFDLVDSETTHRQMPRGWNSPRMSALYWSSADTQTGGAGEELGRREKLTPAGVSKALNLNEPEGWPRTYRGLFDTGLRSEVIEWLEFVVGAGQDEGDVVRAFLQVLRGWDFTLAQSAGALMGRLKGRGRTGEQEDLGHLQTRIRAALRSMTAREWPEAVVDFAETRFVET